ncbi:hypothetical protein J1N35_025191 [Gossypium stocksii]|uniref:Uncharacterized protein n=1 Tax=Gossypium stocksii TaxID=47602 RepID=A0A9D3V787_9ROSI|nr:hypothetical protein J1N35_025191 [Gossypium stocksii]
MNMESGVNCLMLTAGVDVALVSDADTASGVEESLEESTSLSREIDEYMEVRSFMQNVQGGPSGTAVGKESARSRKSQNTFTGTTNITLSSEDEGSLIGKLHHKKSCQGNSYYYSSSLLAVKQGIYFYGKNILACKSFLLVLMR